MPAELLALLVEKTGGWVTGLQLAGQALRGKTPQAMEQYILSLQGSEENIYEYLTTEVFDAQPRPLQNFMLATAIPESFSTALAEALCPEIPAAQAIDLLLRNRLFLSPLDSSADWYRYHDLFRQFLLRQVELAKAAPLAELHGRTAAWLEEHQEKERAIPHYQAGGQPEKAASLLEEVGAELIHRGLRSSVARWLEDVPVTLRHSRPGLAVLQGDLADLAGLWKRAQQSYRQALIGYRRSLNDAGVARVLESLALSYLKYGDTEQLL
jgi:LuxR family maltose regulon positive regulatory protein